MDGIQSIQEMVIKILFTIKIIKMKNLKNYCPSLIEMNELEQILFEGGHQGYAYRFGRALHQTINDISNASDIWDVIDAIF
jgi:hypothetical protein